MNSIIVVGNLGSDAEEKTFNNGQSKYWILNVATSEKWKDKQGEKKEHTTWHRCQLFGNYENLAPYLKKGTTVCVRGLQRNDRYEMKDNGNSVNLNGKPIMLTMPFIKVESINLVGGRRDNTQQQTQNANNAQASTASTAATAQETDDLPF